ncbi:MAG: hypothetical protein PUD95_08365 [Succinatimonas sp.]|nr:hypothetical protein [Succinatimonas sp.]
MKFTKNALSVKSEDVRIISRIKGVGGAEQFLFFKLFGGQIAILYIAQCQS